MDVSHHSKLALKLVTVTALLLLQITTFSSAARGQVTGATLSGLVTDEQGSPVPDANVKIKNLGTGVSREVETNSDGLYSAPNLIPGSYDVTVSAKGFQTAVQRAVTLTVGAQQALNVSLKIGSINQTIEVNAAPKRTRLDFAGNARAGSVQYSQPSRHWFQRQQRQSWIWKSIEQRRAPREREHLSRKRRQHQRLFQWFSGRRIRVESGS